MNAWILKSALVIPYCFSIAVCQAETECPLNREFKPILIQKESRVTSLVRFGRENNVSFGIESLADGATDADSARIAGGNGKSIILQILGPSGAYSLSCSAGVVLVSAIGVSRPTWLNLRVPSYRIRRVQVLMAESMLWMQVEGLLNPHQGGFAGDIPGGDPTDQVGPFDVHDSTVRDLLCLLSKASKGAAWITSKGRNNSELGTASVNRLWTFVEYSRSE